MSEALSKRNYGQYLFLLFNIYVGIRFYLFFNNHATGASTAIPNRPPSVEAYLPIAALISFKHLFATRVFDPIHPAGLAIFLAVVFSALVLRRGFCSWICPVGTVSELTHKAGAKVAMNLKPHRFLDIPLRSFKYIVLIFFILSISGMDAATLAGFIDSPFNRLADVRMLLFFLHPSTTTVAVLAALFMLSLIIKNFWCRYLCPYGALLGLLSKFGLIRIERDAAKCIDCRQCERSCPANIKITERKKVTSSECIMCAECVNACMETHALSIKAAGSKTRIKPHFYGLALVGLFFAFVFAAQATGHWQTNISPAEYRYRIPTAADPSHGHP